MATSAYRRNHNNGLDDAPARSGVRRHAVQLAVVVSDQHDFYEGRLRDMSVASAFVVTHRAHAIGEWIELSILLPDGGEPVRVIGEVRWTREYAGETGIEPGMGVQFRMVSPEDAGRIASFLSHREPFTE